MKIKAVISFAMAFAACFILSLSAFAFTAGDVDNDGKISATDARTVLRASVGLDTLTGEKLKAGDIDGDSKPSASDARMILRASVGLEDLHKHDYKKTVTSAPTCLKGGEQKLTCSCGDVKTEKLPAAGHKSEVIKAVPATCTNAGKSEGAKCSVCGEILTAQKAVPATGHTKVADKNGIAATCTKNGLTQSYHCSVCKELIAEQKIISAKGHILVSDKNGKAATCSKSGLSDSYHCSECKVTIRKQSVIPAGHKFSTKDPTKATKCIVSGCNAVLPAFNEIVNVLKTNNGNKLNFFTCINTSENHSGKMEISGLEADDVGEFGEEDRSVIFEPLCSNRMLTRSNFYTKYQDYVSDLKNSDVKSIKVEPVSEIDFISSLPDEFSDGKFEYNIKSIKTAEYPDVYKITVTLPSEKFDINNKISGSSVYDKIYIQNTKSMLESMREEMIREMSTLDSQITQEEGAEDLKIKTSGNFTASLVVEYFVRMDNYTPIAAKYGFDLDFDLNIKCTGFIQKIIPIYVTMKQNMLMQTNSYYFFYKD